MLPSSRSDSACIPLCAPPRAVPAERALPRLPHPQLHSAAVSAAPAPQSPPATCSGQLGVSQRLHLQPAQGWQGPLAEGTGPGAAGCAADGAAAVCPVEANVSGCWPGRRGTVQAGLQAPVLPG